MKILILFIGIVIFFTACDPTVSKIGESQAGAIKKSLSYFKDTTTGLCFAAIESGRKDKITETTIAITCVPCDSLKRVTLK